MPYMDNDMTEIASRLTRDKYRVHFNKAVDPRDSIGTVLTALVTKNGTFMDQVFLLDGKWSFDKYTDDSIRDAVETAWSQRLCDVMFGSDDGSEADSRSVSKG